MMEGLETERLRFRRMTEEDIPVWVSFLSDPVNKRFNAFYPPNEEGAKAWFANIENRFNRDQTTLFVIEHKETQDFIGMVGPIVQEVDGETFYEVGYHLLAQHRGKGYATEAAKKSMDVLFKQESISTLISIIQPDNLDSIAVAKRNGLQLWKTTSWKGLNVNIYRANKGNVLSL